MQRGDLKAHYLREHLLILFVFLLTLLFSGDVRAQNPCVPLSMQRAHEEFSQLGFPVSH